MVRSSNWSCDGKNVLENCMYGKTAGGHLPGIDEWECRKCDLDFCIFCMKAIIFIQ